MNIDELLEMMSQEFGGKPETMELLSKIDEKVVFEHAANKNFAMGGEKIPSKYKLLLSLAVGAALDNENCVSTYTQIALNKGITKEEILETLLVSRFVKGTSVFSTATPALRMMLEKK